MIQHIDNKVEVARAAASGGVVLFWGLNPGELAAVLTAVYMLMQCLVLMPKVFAVLKEAYTNMRNHVEEIVDDTEDRPSK